MQIQRLTDALSRAYRSKDGHTRDTWVREAWLAFWRVDGWRAHAAWWRLERALARYRKSGTVGDGMATVAAWWDLLELVPPARAALAVLKLWGRNGW